MKRGLPDDDHLALSACSIGVWPPTFPSPQRPCAALRVRSHEVGVATLIDLRNDR